MHKSQESVNDSWAIINPNNRASDRQKVTQISDSGKTPQKAMLKRHNKMACIVVDMFMYDYLHNLWNHPENTNWTKVFKYSSSLLCFRATQALFQEAGNTKPGRLQLKRKANTRATITTTPFTTK